jgi:hypothetical protein
MERMASFESKHKKYYANGVILVKQKIMEIASFLTKYKK